MSYVWFSSLGQWKFNPEIWDKQFLSSWSANRTICTLKSLRWPQILSINSFLLLILSFILFMWHRKSVKNVKTGSLTVYYCTSHSTVTEEWYYLPDSLEYASCATSPYFHVVKPIRVFKLQVKKISKWPRVRTWYTITFTTFAIDYLTTFCKSS